MKGVSRMSNCLSLFLNFMIFPKISELCQELAHAKELLETLWEVYTSNFLIVMLDVKLRKEAGTSKNHYNRISERSLNTTQSHKART